MVDSGGRKMKTVALAGTLDSKAREYAYVKNLLEDAGLKTLIIHTGVFEAEIPADISNADVAAAAGYDIEEIIQKKDRAYATQALSKGMEAIIPRLYEEYRFDGILSFGGTGGTSIVTPGMRALPIGVPKIMVSTVASGDVSFYVGTSDIMMYPSIVDVSGLNSLSTKIFANAAHAMAGMLNYEVKQKANKKPLIAATMFGVTTPCVDAAREYLEKKGFEVLVFHATGTGGKTMEALINSGFFAGVLDLTTTEWCDELFGGVLAAGEHRSEAAAIKGIPQVVSVGAMDMINFGTIDTLPENMQNRNIYRHNPSVTLVRTTTEENRALGEKLAQKLNMAHKKTVLLLPLKGVSMIDAEGQPFYGKEEDEALFETLKRHIDTQKVKVIELPLHINDKKFAQKAAEILIALIEES